MVSLRACLVLLLIALISALWLLGPGHRAVAAPGPSAPGAAAKSDTSRAASGQLERAQRYLHSRGLFHQRPDGRMSPATRAALKAFQKKRGLKITGTLDAETLVAMQLAAASPAPVTGK